MCHMWRRKIKSKETGEREKKCSLGMNVERKQTDRKKDQI